MPLMKQLVDTIKNYAIEHYDEGGWDVVSECFTDEEIQEHLVREKATTKEEAIKAFQWLVNIWAERQADARNSAF